MVPMGKRSEKESRDQYFIIDRFNQLPVGNGPKAYEIWHSGYYPVAWTNKKYKMIYMNMGHNDMDYEYKTNATLSYTFANEEQNKFIIDGLLWLGNGKKP